MPIEILMPALSPTMEEGTLSKWLVKEGDTVSSGDLLAEIETDKATMEVEAVEEGKIVKILVEGGTDGVKVNAPIAILLEEDEDESALDGYEAGGGSEKEKKAEPEDEDKSEEKAEKSKEDKEPETESKKESKSSDKKSEDKKASSGKNEDGDRIKASPLAKRLAKEAGIELSDVSGSGPNGRIVKADIEGFKPSEKSEKKADKQADKKSDKAAESSDSTEVGAVRSGGADYLAKMGVEAGTYDLEPLDGMRKAIAKRACLRRTIMCLISRFSWIAKSMSCSPCANSSMSKRPKV